MTSFFLFLSMIAMFVLFINGLWWVLSEFFLPLHSSQKFIYISLVAGTALLISLTGFLGTKIDKEIEERRALVNEKLEIEQEFRQLRWEYERLVQENDHQQHNTAYDKLDERMSDIERAVEEREEQKLEFGTKQQRLKEQIERLHHDLDRARSENTQLKMEIENLQVQLEKDNRSDNYSTAFYSSRADHMADSMEAHPEAYSNCIELNKAYSSGVGSDHHAYDSSMDYDNDGWACE